MCTEWAATSVSSRLTRMRSSGPPRTEVWPRSTSAAAEREPRLVCGFLGCRNVTGNPLLSALPPVLRLDTREGSAAEWIRVSFEFAADEIAAGRAGSDMVARIRACPLIGQFNYKTF